MRRPEDKTRSQKLLFSFTAQRFRRNRNRKDPSGLGSRVRDTAARPHATPDLLRNHVTRSQPNIFRSSCDQFSSKPVSGACLTFCVLSVPARARVLQKQDHVITVNGQLVKLRLSEAVGHHQSVSCGLDLSSSCPLFSCQSSSGRSDVTGKGGGGKWAGLLRGGGACEPCVLFSQPQKENPAELLPTSKMVEAARSKQVFPQTPPSLRLRLGGARRWCWTTSQTNSWQSSWWRASWAWTTAPTRWR